MSLAMALELCGLTQGERFSVAAIRDREIRAECFDTVEAAEQFLAPFAEGWNLYFCGNPVKPGTTGKPRAEDVSEGRVLLIDCDPERGPEGEADGTAAREAILEARAYINEKTGHLAPLIFSGRGYQLWLRISGLDDGQRRALARGLALKFGRDGARFDGTHNLDRLMRIPGTVNTKTGRRAEILG